MAENVPNVHAPILGSVEGLLPSGSTMSGRLQQILTNDVFALVRSVSDIESVLSDYERKDIAPPWAEALYGRLDVLEVRSKQLDAHVRLGPANLGTGDDRVLNKFKNEVGAQLNLAKYAIETRVSATSVEIGRLQKLLDIRPTTSELTSIVSIVNTTRDNIEDLFRKTKRSIRDYIALATADEIKEMKLQIESNEQMGEGVHQDLNKKVDDFIKDLHRMRQGIHGLVTGILNRLDEAESGKGDLYKNSAENSTMYDGNLAMARGELQTIKNEQESSNQSFIEFKAYNKQQFVNISEAVNRIVEKDSIHVLERYKEVEDHYIKVNEENREWMNSFKSDVLYSVKETRESIMDQTKLSKEFEKRLMITTRDVKPFRDNDIGVLFKRFETKYAENNDLFENTEGAVNACDIKSNKLVKISETLDEEGRLLPSLYTTLVEHVDAISTGSVDSTSVLQQLKTHMDHIHSNLDALLSMKGTVSAVTEYVTSLENKATQYEGYLEKLQDNFNRNKEILVTQTAQVEKNSEALGQACEDFVGEMTLKMDEKSMLTYNQVREIQDNVSIMERQVETQADKKSLKSITQQLLMGKKGDKKGVDGGSSSLVFSDGRPNGSGLLEGASLTETATSIDTESNLEALMEEGASAIAEISDGVGVTEKEQRTTINTQASILARLCLTYEEKCVRAAYINDIPSNVCEHIINCSIALASFFSNCVDAEMIQKVLKPSQSFGEYSSYKEDAAIDRRAQKLTEFTDLVHRIVRQINNSSGAIRHGARNRFLSQLKKALDLCMSKHTQVILVGTSLFGRIKYPSTSQFYVPTESREITLAPSASKRNNDPYAIFQMDDDVELFEEEKSFTSSVNDDQNSANNPQFPIAPSLSPMISHKTFEEQITDSQELPRNIPEAVTNEQLHSMATSLPLLPSKQPPINPKTGRLQKQLNTIKTQKISMDMASSAANTQPTSNKESQPYILRGGFKMPKAQLSLSMQAAMAGYQSISLSDISSSSLTQNVLSQSTPQPVLPNYIDIKVSKKI
jgi:hypothetical protein